MDRPDTPRRPPLPDWFGAQSLLDSLPDVAVGVFDRDLCCVALGGQALAGLPLHTGAHIGKLPNEILPPEIAHLVLPGMRLAIVGIESTRDLVYGEHVYEVRLAPVRQRGEVVGGIGSALEVTDRRRIEAALRQSEERFRLMVDAVRDYAIVSLDRDGHVSGWNPGAARITGYASEDIIGEHVSAFSPPEDVPAGRPGRALALAAAHGRYEQDEAWRIRKDGSLYLANVVVTAVHDDGGELRGFVEVTRDITEQHNAAQALEEAYDLREALLVTSPDVISLYDAGAGSEVWSSRSYPAMLGYSPAQAEQFGGERQRALVHPDDLPAFLDANLAAAELPAGQTIDLRHRVWHADGSVRWVNRRMTPFDRNGGGMVVLAATSDVTAQVEVERSLAHDASHDALTGLPNRRAITDRLARALSHTGEGWSVAVLLCDLNGFKAVNDNHGHPAGDEVLVVTAARLRASLRSGDTAGRLGGDEFVVILEGPDRAALKVAADEVARRIGEDLRAPIVARGVAHQVTASIGTAIAGPGPTTPDELLHLADQAMYQVKANGNRRRRSPRASRAEVGARKEPVIVPGGDGVLPFDDLQPSGRGG